MKRRWLFLLLFCCGASFGQSDEEIFAELSIVCVATLGVASILTEAELSKMIFTRDAKWWRTTALQLIDASDADTRIETAMNDLKDAWNNEEITWDEILNMSRKCSEMKIAFEAPAG